jgi:hypothetical protein
MDAVAALECFGAGVIVRIKRGHMNTVNVQASAGQRLSDKVKIP